MIEVYIVRRSSTIAERPTIIGIFSDADLAKDFAKKHILDETIYEVYIEVYPMNNYNDCRLRRVHFYDAITQKWTTTYNSQKE